MKTRLSRYFDIVQDGAGNERMEVGEGGIALLRLVLTNKGTAFTREERIELGLDGLLPPQVNTLEQQVERAHRGYLAEATPIAKYQFLRSLQERQEVLFYALLERHLAEMLPIVYTPTVGDAVMQFSALYQYPRGLSFSPENIHRAEEIIASYPLDDVRMIVATDSSAILGIGDQGYGGLAIPIGKLALYTVGGGVSPFHTMPVSLDVGTDRDDLLEDPFYLGTRQKRLRGDAYLAFLDRFVAAVKKRWPHAIIQWEDLGKDTAFTVLERYREVTPSFNDDIQGTGAVALAGLISACRSIDESINQQTVVIHGAGAGGVGVAWAIHRGMVRAGAKPEDAFARIFVLDSRGLLTDDRKMEDYKRPFAQPRARLATWASAASGGVPDLLETVTHGGATVLLGLSGQPRAFTELVVRQMAKGAARPMIFPLSNPTTSAEALPEDLLAWTEGRALVATGSPFAPVERGGRTFTFGQGNNAFVFPGLGAGAILAGARVLTDGMVAEAAQAVADYTARTHPGDIYPPVTELPEVSVEVAVRVIAQAQRENVAGDILPTEPSALTKLVRTKFWRPRYLPIVRAGK
jgi:malate dehydrogenase (oxaloacetate-decarboxylating)